MPGRGFGRGRGIAGRSQFPPRAGTVAKPPGALSVSDHDDSDEEGMTNSLQSTAGGRGALHRSLSSKERETIAAAWEDDDISVRDDDGGEDETETDAQQQALHAYSAMLQDPSAGIPLSNRRVRLTTYKNCFSGTDAAGWFMANMEGVETPDAALGVGNMLIDLGVIVHVKGNKPFTLGDSDLFQFCSVGTDGESNSRGGSASARRSSGPMRTRPGSAASTTSRRSSGSLGGWSTSSRRDSVGSIDQGSLASFAAALRDADDPAAGFDTVFGAGDGVRSELHIAAGRGDVAKLRSLALEHGVDSIDAEGRTPLMYAVIADKAKACKMLIKQAGANINARDDHGNTPLMWAACRGCREAMKELLRNGADLALADLDGRTALHWSTKLSRTDCLDYLLRVAFRTVLNTKDDEQLTALHWAAMCGHAAHVERLIRAQADPTIGDSQGRTPLHYAVSGNAVDVLTLLLSECRGCINVPDAQGRTSLHAACGEGSTDAVALLLNTPGIDTNATDNRLTTPLHWAAVTNRPDVCRVLLTNGAKLMARDAAGLSALHYATEKGFHECASVMQRYGGTNGRPLSAGHPALDPPPQRPPAQVAPPYSPVASNPSLPSRRQFFGGRGGGMSPGRGSFGRGAGLQGRGGGRPVPPPGYTSPDSRSRKVSDAASEA